MEEENHTRLYPNNFNRDIGIKIPEACVLTVKKKTTAREPGGGGPQRESDPNDTPNTAMEFYQFTAELNSTQVTRTHSTSSTED